MGEINLLELEPTTISRDLKGKYICLYGKPKTGKTTFAVQAPRNLLLAFEKGYNALGGVKVQDINSWVDFKKVLAQLRDERVRAMYDTISIDTVGIMWDLCEKYICIQNGVTKISEIQWGAGYKACKDEFDKALRDITMLGYGLIIIAHVDIKTEKTPEGEDVEIIGPAIPARAYAIVNQLVDIIGYIKIDYNADGTSERWLYTRATPRVMAGSRFAHLPAKIRFSYNDMANSLADAIEMAGKLDGVTIVDKAPIAPMAQKREFEDIRNEAAAVWKRLLDQNQNNVDKMGNIIENIFGSRIKLSEVTIAQQDLFELALDELKKLLVP